MLRTWDRLSHGSRTAGLFDPASVEDVPEPARRWIRHAIAPGTPLQLVAELDQHGTIKLGGWRPFRAEQILAPSHGYVWASTTRLAGLPIRGYDLLHDAAAQMRYRILDAVPVMSLSGSDLARSAAGRLAAEIIWVPALALTDTVHWAAVDERRVTAVVEYLQWTHEVMLTVAPSGAVEKVTLPRWARVGKQPWGVHRFEAVLQDEATFGGYTVPTHATAGYDLDTARLTDTAFITQTIDSAAYL